LKGILGETVVFFNNKSTSGRIVEKEIKSGNTDIDYFSFTLSKETGKGTDTYVVKARLNKHMPEILPIAGKRLYVSYPGQLRQCRKCFVQGHSSVNCTNAKVDWLDYVLMLKNSGEFRKELFEGWKAALDLYRPDPSNTDLRNVINFNKAQGQNQGTPQPPRTIDARANSTTDQPLGKSITLAK